MEKGSHRHVTPLTKQRARTQLQIWKLIDIYLQKKETEKAGPCECSKEQKACGSVVQPKGIFGSGLSSQPDYRKSGTGESNEEAAENQRPPFHTALSERGDRG